jgi:HAD superfamily hydrolase (TIGR01450 family)
MTIKAVIADLDGTVIRGNSLIPSADTTYENLKRIGVKWIFMSNNAGSLAPDLAVRLNDLGVYASQDEVLNSASALISELERNRSGARVLVIGSGRLREGVSRAGAVLTQDPMAAQIVVSAMDKEFNYDKLAAAQKAIHNGALFWATNLDATLPVEDGFRPGSGSIVSAIATAAGKRPDRIFGKPQTDLAEMALEMLGMERDDLLVVGDRMETDILFAKNAGLMSALVLTGASAREDIGRFDFEPDHILETINDIESIL